MAAVNAALNLMQGMGSDSGEEAMDAEVAAPAPAAGRPAPAAPPAAAAQSGSGGAGGPIAASDLAAILGGILSGAGTGGGSGLAAALQRQRASAADPGPTLGDVLKPELLAPLLRSPDMVQRLAQYLPEEHR